MKFKNDPTLSIMMNLAKLRMMEQGFHTPGSRGYSRRWKIIFKEVMRENGLFIKRDSK